MATVTLSVSYDDTQNAASVANRLAKESHARTEAMNDLASEFVAIACGARRADVTLSVESADNTKASTTVTLGGAALTANDTLSIGSVTLTWKATASTENDVEIGQDDAESTDNLAAAIEAHSVLSGVVAAESDGATVVTVSSALPGLIGEMITVAKTEANSGAMALGASALGGVTSTVESAPRTYELGG